MKKKFLKAVPSSLSALLLAGAQLSVLVAVVVSQLGERAFRGPRGFATYREALIERG